MCSPEISPSDTRTIVAVLSRRLKAGDDSKVCAAVLGCLCRVLTSPAGVTAAREVLSALEPAVGLVRYPGLRSPVARFVTALVVQAGSIEGTAKVLFSRGLDSHEVRTAPKKAECRVKAALGKHESASCRFWHAQATQIVLPALRPLFMRPCPRALLVPGLNLPAGSSNCGQSAGGCDEPRTPRLHRSQIQHECPQVLQHCACVGAVP